MKKVTENLQPYAIIFAICQFTTILAVVCAIKMHIGFIAILAIPLVGYVSIYIGLRWDLKYDNTEIEQDLQKIDMSFIIKRLGELEMKINELKFYDYLTKTNFKGAIKNKNLIKELKSTTFEERHIPYGEVVNAIKSYNFNSITLLMSTINTLEQRQKIIDKYSK